MNSGTTPDPNLLTIIERWPTLPLAIRAGILAIVNATEKPYVSAEASAAP